MKHFLNIAVIAAFLGSLLFMDSRAKGARIMPAGTAPAVARVGSQASIYGLYRDRGIRGARIVHLNRFLNMVEYLPREETTSMPFPVRVQDAKPLYEKGLDGHNWLFIANRTGLVRTVTVVLPAAVMRERTAQFDGTYAYARSGGGFRGYTFDLPLLVTTLDALPDIDEPVIVNIDAGYFVTGEEPEAVAAALRKHCPDVRLIALSASLDEPEIDDGARRRLERFGTVWAGGR